MCSCGSCTVGASTSSPLSLQSVCFHRLVVAAPLLLLQLRPELKSAYVQFAEHAQAEKAYRSPKVAPATAACPC